MKKNVLLCVSGGIAVYKAVALVSKLTQANFNVKVIMTASAREFVNPLSFQVMSKNDVFFDTFDEKESAVIAHIDLADWADLIVVAPATANVIGKLANGIADDMVTTTLLAATAPVWVAPAMNVHMYDHPAVKRNMAQLYADGYRFIEPSEGYLACGYVGKGRLEEPEKITALIQMYFSNEAKQAQKPLKGKKVIISAGTTREKVDSTHYVTHFSSRNTGYLLAQVAQQLGAEVVLVTGPTTLEKPTGIKSVDVESTQQMVDVMLAHYLSADIVIQAATVAGYRPKLVDDGLAVGTIELERTPDILAILREHKQQQLLIAFTEGEETQKLDGNVDYIVVNNKTLIGKNGIKQAYSHMSDADLAQQLLATILESEALS